MSALTRIQALCMLVMLVGFVWLTVDVFSLTGSDSLRAACVMTWIGLLGNAVCVLVRASQKRKKQ